MEDHALKWDLIKCEIRGTTIEYCKRSARERREQKVTLANQVNELEHRLSEQPTEDIAEQYQSTKQELELLITQESLNAAFLAKVDNLEFDGKNPKYFVNQAKKTVCKKNLSKTWLQKMGKTSQVPKM